MKKSLLCLLLTLSLILPLLPVSGEEGIDLDALMADIQATEEATGEAAKRFSDMLALLPEGTELYTDEALSCLYGTLRAEARAFVVERVEADEPENDLLLIGIAVSGAVDLLWIKAGESLPLTSDEQNEPGVGTQVPGTNVWLSDADVILAAQPEELPEEPVVLPDLVTEELIDNLLSETVDIDPDPKNAAQISQQPETQEATVGDEVSVSVTASNVKAYLWQYSYDEGETWKNCASGGYNTDTYTYTVESKHFGRLMRCRLTGMDGAVQWTETAALHEALVINTQPEHLKADVGDKIFLTVGATGVKAYRWQYSYDAGESWKNCSSGGSDTKKYTYTVTAQHYNRLIRCRLTKWDGSYVYTDEVSLGQELVISAEPEDQKADVGDQVSLTVEAKGVKAYLWQYSYDNGETWKNCATGGHDTKTYTYTVLEKHYDRLMRCRLTDRDGERFYTRTVKLGQDLVITAQPESMLADVGDTVTLTVEAKGVKAYLWQYSYDNGETWKNCASGGFDTSAYTYTVAEKHYGRLLRCRLTGRDGENVYTDAASLSQELVINTQPQHLKAEVGDKISLTVEAVGAAAYRWQYSYDNGETWQNCSSGGADTKKYTYTVTAQHYGRLLRCRLTTRDGDYVYTDAVSLGQELIIVTDAQDMTGNVGDVLTVTVEATGAMAYRWQYSYDNGETWKNCSSGGADTKKYTYTVTAQHYGRLLRCRMKDRDGEYTYSSSVGLSQEALSIITEPADQQTVAGREVTVSVEIEGVKSYLWQYSYDNGETWKNCASGGYNTNAYTFTVESKHFGRVLRCKMTSYDGQVLCTRTVSLEQLIFDYVILSSGGAQVTGYYGTDAEVTVPATLGGATVTEIGVAAFAGNKTITRVNLPDTVRYIRERAFQGCSNLQWMN